ncbi:unnamed protein product [Amoebophrya sp. A120]|nr:unnamed protein product [Amoebophrya sp. A120]|eukprot:GSA120T00016303001.1
MCREFFRRKWTSSTGAASSSDAAAASSSGDLVHPSAGEQGGSCRSSILEPINALTLFRCRPPAGMTKPAAPSAPATDGGSPAVSSGSFYCNFGEDVEKSSSQLFNRHLGLVDPFLDEASSRLDELRDLGLTLEAGFADPGDRERAEELAALDPCGARLLELERRVDECLNFYVPPDGGSSVDEGEPEGESVPEVGWHARLFGSEYDPSSGDDPSSDDARNDPSSDEED